MEETLVSIIVPVYNTEKYLQRCIDSLLAQTYRNIEIILVNDGSTDDSLRIIHDAAENDSRIKVISQANKGLSSARNSGMAVAMGDYLLFCDSDDTVEPEWVDRLLNAAKEYPDSLVVSGHNRIFCHSNETVTLEKMVIPGGRYSKECYYSLISPGITGIVCTKIFSRSLLVSKDISFDENVKYAEDVVFILKYINHVKAFYVLDDALYNYYQYDRNTRQTITSNVSRSQMRYIYQIRLPFIKKEDLPEFQQMYFFNLWSRFIDLEERNDIKRSDRWHEMRDILNDEVFQRYVAEHGSEAFESRSLPLIKKKALARYEALQWVSKQKNALISSLKEFHIKNG